MDEEDSLYSLETSSLSEEKVTSDFFGDSNNQSSQLSESSDSEMSQKPFFHNGGIDVPFKCNVVTLHRTLGTLGFKIHREDTDFEFCGILGQTMTASSQSGQKLAVFS